MRECFVVEGRVVGVFPSSRVFELHVYDDGTLSGSVLNPEGDDEASDAKLLHGTAAKQSLAGDDSQEQEYQVKFQLAKAMARTRALPGDAHVVTVEGTLTRSSGLHGRWADMGNIFEFFLSIRQPRRDERDSQVTVTTDHTLYPLTPGFYTLKGAAVSHSGRVFSTTCSLKLRARGDLEGTSTDDGQVSRVTGSWTPTGIHYTHLGFSKEFVYDGKAYAHAIRGLWKPSDDPDPSDLNCGTFDFEAVDSCRAWNHSSHKHHPQVFRDIVRLCLLSSLQTSQSRGMTMSWMWWRRRRRSMPRLPSHLWSEVFSFCDFDWFSPPDSLSY